MGLSEGANVADASEKLNQKIGMPENLSQMGLNMSDGPGIVENALVDLAHRGNARPATEGDYEAIYEAALG